MSVSDEVLETAKKLTELCKLHIEIERMGEHQEQVMDCVVAALKADRNFSKSIEAQETIEAAYLGRVG